MIIGGITMKKIIMANGKKYAPIETAKLPEIGSQSFGHFLISDFPTVCDSIEELKADDGSTIYLAHYARKSNSEDAGKVLYILRKEESK